MLMGHLAFHAKWKTFAHVGHRKCAHLHTKGETKQRTKYSWTWISISQTDQNWPVGYQSVSVIHFWWLAWTFFFLLVLLFQGAVSATTDFLFYDKILFCPEYFFFLISFMPVWVQVKCFSQKCKAPTFTEITVFILNWPKQTWVHSHAELYLMLLRSFKDIICQNSA